MGEAVHDLFTNLSSQECREEAMNGALLLNVIFDRFAAPLAFIHFEEPHSSG